MGTGRSGRYLKTRGSRYNPSRFTLVHSTEGGYQKRTNGEIGRMKSGGHGQAAIDLMKSHGSEFEILKTFSNGVRTGNVFNHLDRRKRLLGGQAWFPVDWNEGTIRRAGKHVASLKRNRGIKEGVPAFGIYKTR